MRDPPTDTSTYASAKSRSRLHWTTWLLGILVFSVLLLLNLGGERHVDTDRIHHGWPFVFETRFVHKSENNSTIYSDKDLVWTRLFQPHFRVEHFYTWHVMANLGVSLLLLAITCGFWGYRIRQLKHWLQFRLWDWLLFCVCLSACCAFLFDLYRDKRTEQQLLATLNQHGIAIDSFSFGNSNNGDDQVIMSSGTDVPFDWLWEFAGIPMNLRPYRRVHLLLSISANPERKTSETTPIPTELFQILQRLRALKTLNLTISNKDAQQLSCDAKHWPQLNQIPNLNAFYLMVTGEFLNEQHVQSLSHVQKFEDLWVSDAPAFNGKNLGLINELKFLGIRRCGITDDTLVQINQLQQLEKLILYGNKNLTTGGWQQLKLSSSLKHLSFGDDHSQVNLAFIRNCKSLKSLSISFPIVNTWESLASCRELTVLDISCPNFNDAAFSNLKNLQQLTRLLISRHSLRSGNLTSLKKLSSLESLSVSSPKEQKKANGKQGISSVNIYIDPQLGITEKQEREYKAILESE